ncbi:hypothetical protein TREMEDRAFT_27507 [Tremella mesenterica DSM 1558]|uniref:uncharacterized protein n=1 Tax=Tremella mesenterica (strain ATCC 24925 / CBS 8224 / DSM 1558 / NBRC 9311 / NRRL Y-6157 / RJB 2259-6 / UBC 559-6) TaxID=578456 RepID=UPI0003F49822|nr:uncharacterized protein TREMEDRAFT_27507 [Tremella mesenterica DSM 1558]EIW71049.1 hypothetical protein TREMEDRAFT_27507 [Tremella mesenterica DSM 1558]
MTTFDRRRIQAPETSYAPTFESSSIIVDNGLGTGDDGFHVGSSQPVFKAGLIDQANGSGYVEIGGVKIACSVYGPRPKQPPYSPEGTLNLEIKFAPFASHPRRAPLRDTEPIPLSTLLYRLLLPCLQLHLLPKSSIDVFLLILESDTLSNTLSAALTVASGAIANAGIPMSALGIGGVVARGEGAGGEKRSELICDPSIEEENSAEACLTLGVMPALGKLSSCWFTGEADVEDVGLMVDCAVKETKMTHAVLATGLLESADVS